MGEAGIYPITAEMATALREACDTHGVPLIADEVQSGMGRSGTFLAGTQVGLKPDYIVLAKALGGGIAKLGVVLIHERWYHREFEFIHSSTFAKDGFSTRIALKVLEMLEADNGTAYELAAERGAKAKAALEGVRADYPEIVKEVRGKGLMLGFEFHDAAGSEQPAVREAHQVVPFMIMAHLHRAHRFRIARTASGPWTFRFEPSIYLTDEEIARVEAAFRDVADILRSGDLSRFR
jgi:acetylornithine/succinyldiaminopimelate/putrescine aminotransferase